MSRNILSYLFLFAVLLSLVYFEFVYFPFTTECYYVWGHVVYDTPCTVLSTILESLGLVVLASLFSNKRVFLVTGVVYFGFPLIMGATTFDRTLAGIALILSVLFVLFGSPGRNFKVAFTWVLGVHVYSLMLFFLWVPLMIFFDHYFHPRELLEGLLIILFLFSPLLWKYRGCSAFFAFSGVTYVLLYFLIPGFYPFVYEALLSLAGLFLCLKGGVGNGFKTRRKS